MSMNRSDYQASYKHFQAFIECNARDATHSVSKHPVPGCRVLTAPSGKPSYSHESADLSLCASCLEFWRESVEHGDETAWQMAVYLRDLRASVLKTSPEATSRAVILAKRSKAGLP